MKRLGFKEYNDFQEPLQESSWLSKGFAFAQSRRHESFRQQLESAAKQVQSLSDRGRSTEDVGKKIDLLFQALSKLAEAQRISGELSRSSINVAVASNLLEDNIKTLISKMKGRV